MDTPTPRATDGAPQETPTTAPATVGDVDPDLSRKHAPDAPPDPLRALLAQRRRHGRPGPKTEAELMARAHRHARGERLIDLEPLLGDLHVPMDHDSDPPWDDGEAHPYEFLGAVAAERSQRPFRAQYRTLSYDLDARPIPEHPRNEWVRRTAETHAPEAWRRRLVARTRLFSRSRQVWVSTVFLGLDCGYSGPPVLWETMLFNGSGHDCDGRCWRYRSRRAALSGHHLIVTTLRAELAAAPAPGRPR